MKNRKPYVELKPVGIKRIELWKQMDLIVMRSTNKKVVSYWKKYGKPLPEIPYSKLTSHTLLYESEFKKCCFTKIWECFCHCMCMTLDKDVEEYINCLEALKERT